MQTKAPTRAEVQVDKIQLFVCNCPSEPRPHFVLFAHWSRMREKVSWDEWRQFVTVEVFPSSAWISSDWMRLSYSFLCFWLFPIPFFTFLYDNVNKSIANKHNGRLFVALDWVLYAYIPGIHQSNLQTKKMVRGSLKREIGLPRNYGTINGIIRRFSAQHSPN